MPDILDASKLLEGLTYDPDRVARPEPVTQEQLLAAADAQIVFIGKGVRRDITFVCVRCGLPQSFRLWERFSLLTADEITTRIGRECIGRVLANSRIAEANGLHLEVNALSLKARRNLDGAVRVLGCDWAVWGVLGDLGCGIDVVLDIPTKPRNAISGESRVHVSFPFAPVETAQALYALLGGKGAPRIATD